MGVVQLPCALVGRVRGAAARKSATGGRCRCPRRRTTEIVERLRDPPQQLVPLALRSNSNSALTRKASGRDRR